jgi:flagellar L-ring protein precursor FlgH
MAALLATSSLISACSATLDKLENVGKPPKMSEVTNPNEQPGAQALSWPMPETQPAPKQYANSLWQPGSRTFFRDQRAARVGDILRVNVKIKDKADLTNQTQRNRSTSEKSSAPSIFGLEDKIFGWMPGKAVPAALLQTAGNTNTQGTGNFKREEKIETQVAALITQILPNGNLVIEGSQEIRVNYELREVSVKGVVRPEDILSDNSIDSTQIAQARINYGGRGQLADVQQPPWGNQVVEALSPF